MTRKLIHRLKLYAERLLSRRILVVPRGHIHGMCCTDDLHRQGHQFTCLFDVGAHWGETTLTFAEAFPQAAIYCFEPVEANFRELTKNCKGISAKCFPIALGSTRTSGEMFLSDASTAHTLISPEGRTKEHRYSTKQDVYITTIDIFCREHEVDIIDLLKVDAEGYDFEVLKGARDMLSSGKISYVMTEVGLDPRKQYFVSFETIRDYLFTLGFELFGLYDQTTGWGQRRSLLLANAMFVHQSAPRRALSDQAS